MYPSDDTDIRLRLLVQQVRQMRARLREQMERSSALCERVLKMLPPERRPPPKL